jgi:hypothetical protein
MNGTSWGTVDGWVQMIVRVVDVESMMRNVALQ